MVKYEYSDLQLVNIFLPHHYFNHLAYLTGVLGPHQNQNWGIMQHQLKKGILYSKVIALVKNEFSDFQLVNIFFLVNYAYFSIKIIIGGDATSAEKGNFI